MHTFPSIFNDVIGPVVRGPSSSHCAAALRIGRLARCLMDDNISQVLVEYDLNGSLATTHESHGSDMGLFGGLLGWDATDERLPKSVRAIQDAGMQVQIEIKETGDTHPNTYRLTLKNQQETHRIIAVSTGGGMIEIVRIDDIALSIAGGLIGVFIAAQSTFAAEVCGCQAECGAASGMAAAALCSLADGTLNQCTAAASIALQNVLGLICDPVANRVEVPCLGKNIMAATNALACANMALADYDSVISLDEVIETMDRVGRSIPRDLRCTALGGYLSPRQQRPLRLISVLCKANNWIV